MYCKFCQHFEQLDMSAKPYVGWDGECVLARSWEGQQTVGQTLAKALDIEHYGADLLVKRDFGCVQFALRTPPSSTVEKQNKELNHYGP